MVPARWSRTNVFQVCEGGRSGRSGGFGMYLATVSLSTQRGFTRDPFDRSTAARTSYKYASGPRNRKAAQRTTQASMAAVARYPPRTRYSSMPRTTGGQSRSFRGGPWGGSSSSRAWPARGGSSCPTRAGISRCSESQFRTRSDSGFRSVVFAASLANASKLLIRPGADSDTRARRRRQQTRLRQVDVFTSSAPRGIEDRHAHRVDVSAVVTRGIGVAGPNRNPEVIRGDVRGGPGRPQVSSGPP